jgi:hypothetical protein
MREFDEKTPFFRKFMETLTSHRLQVAGFGMMLRLGIGASLSILDVGSDAVAVADLFKQGETVLACALIAMLVVNVFFQLGLVKIQAPKRGWATAKKVVMTVIGKQP